MDETERALQELRLELELLKAQNAHVRWYTIASGIASILGASLALITLVTLLNKLAM